MTFRSSALQGVSRLEAAGRNSPPMRAGERSDGVVVLQGALIDLGFPMPKSTARTGVPDGIYGRETIDAVRAFQRQQGLAVDGSAGRQTITRLDHVHALRMGAHDATAAPPAPPKAPAPSPGSAYFEPGHHDPMVAHDAGAGRWKSEPASAVMKGKRRIMLTDSFRQATSRYPGPDASRHLTHFMENTGTSLVFDLGRMVQQSRQAKYHFDSEVYRAQQYAETLPAGEHLFTARHAHSGNNDPGDSPNWFFAVGGYAAWGKGRAFVTEVGGVRRYRLELIYKASDRYNWDGNKGVDLSVAEWLEKYVGEGTTGDLDFKIEVTDEELALFHRQGLAREYDMAGSMRRACEWTHGNGMKKPPMYIPPGLP